MCSLDLSGQFEPDGYYRYPSGFILRFNEQQIHKQLIIMARRLNRDHLEVIISHLRDYRKENPNATKMGEMGELSTALQAVGIKVEPYQFSQRARNSRMPFPGNSQCPEKE